MTSTGYEISSLTMTIGGVVFGSYLTPVTSSFNKISFIKSLSDAIFFSFFTSFSSSL